MESDRSFSSREIHEVLDQEHMRTSDETFVINNCWMKGWSRKQLHRELIGILSDDGSRRSQMGLWWKSGKRRSVVYQLSAGRAKDLTVVSHRV
jgi:hypothetical protein